MDRVEELIIRAPKDEITKLKNLPSRKQSKAQTDDVLLSSLLWIEMASNLLKEINSQKTESEVALFDQIKSYSELNTKYELLKREINKSFWVRFKNWIFKTNYN